MGLWTLIVIAIELTSSYLCFQVVSRFDEVMSSLEDVNVVYIEEKGDR